MRELDQKTRPQLNFLEEFNFQETAVIAGNMTIGEVIALKPVVENMGLDWSSQLKRLKRDDPNSQLWSFQKFIADDKKAYDMVCMTPLNFQNWLYGFTPSENMNVALWEEYKKGLVVNLLMMLKISMDEVLRLRSFESRYNRLKGEFVEYVNETEEGKSLNKLAKEKWKSSNDRKKRILDILNEDGSQMTLDL